jgi:hypothetical protein
VPDEEKSTHIEKSTPPAKALDLQKVIIMRKVLFYCGIGTCQKSGTILISEEDWGAKRVQHSCPECGQLLQQERFHFEDLNQELQAERMRMCRTKGPLTLFERRRLRVIHAALGNEKPKAWSAEEGIAMARASTVMRFIRNQEMT